MKTLMLVLALVTFGCTKAEDKPMTEQEYSAFVRQAHEEARKKNPDMEPLEEAKFYDSPEAYEEARKKDPSLPPLDGGEPGTMASSSSLELPMATNDPGFKELAENAGGYRLLLYYYADEYGGMSCGTSQGVEGVFAPHDTLGYCAKGDYIMATVVHTDGGEWTISRMECMPDLRTPEAGIARRAADNAQSRRAHDDARRKGKESPTVWARP